jgi:hypothetical protein
MNKTQYEKFRAIAGKMKLNNIFIALRQSDSLTIEARQAFNDELKARAIVTKQNREDAMNH